MEKAGTGIQRVKNDCRNNGNNVYFTFADSFWVTIKTNRNSNVLKDVLDNVPDNVLDNVLDNRLEKIINLIRKNNKILLREISDQLNVSKRTIRRDIEKLKKQNKLKRVGTEKTGHWVILDKAENRKQKTKDGDLGTLG